MSDVASGDKDPTIEALPIEDRASLLYGAGPWELRPPASTGLLPLVMTDGPNGPRGADFHTGMSACFPCETALAATWDPDLVSEVARAIGEQTRRKGAGMLLAPTVNLHRNPLGGRNFECFSEDPELTARMTTAYVTGVQSRGVACCVKHLVGNEQETGRHVASSEVDDATLRELYLVPFEAAAAAGAWSMMAAYPKLNGTYATEHPWLLTTLLREEWGWDGVVVSDWFATQSTAAALNAGLDVEMPGPSQLRGEKLLKALADGEVTEEAIDTSARRVIRLLERTQARVSTGTEPAGGIDANADDDLAALIRRAAARGMVLLRNTGTLPLTAETIRTLAVIGPGADSGQPQGGGSCQVNPPHVISPVTALAAALGPGTTVTFARGQVDAARPRTISQPAIITPDGTPGATIEFRRRADDTLITTQTATSLSMSWLAPVLDGYASEDLRLRIRATLAPSESGRHTLTLSSIGRATLTVNGTTVLEQDGPGGRDVVFDLSKQTLRADADLSAHEPADLTVDYEPLAGADFLRLQVGLIPPAPPTLLDDAVRLAVASDAAVVIVEHPPGAETEGIDRTTLSLTDDQNEMVSMVTAANPRTVVVVNTGSPIAMPWADQAGAIVQLWYPGQELGDSLADVLTGAVNPGGKLPCTFPAREQDAPSWPYYPGTDEKAVYGEGLAMGYRGLVSEPLFPFGFGLSYSTFELGEPAADGYTVTVPVTNTSTRTGREVVQLYVRLGDREYRELKAFASVEVEPGQTVPAVLHVPADRLRRWVGGRWVLEQGPVEAWVGTSSADADLRHKVVLR